MIIIIVYTFISNYQGAAVMEWLSSWFEPGSCHFDFRDLVSPVKFPSHDMIEIC